MLAPESQKSGVCAAIHLCLMEPPSSPLCALFILSFPLFSASSVPHPNSFAYSTLIALAQVLNYFQTARLGMAGTQGTIWTYYIKEFMI